MKTIRRKNPGATPKAHQQTLDRIEFLAEESMRSARQIIELVEKVRSELTEEDEEVGDEQRTPRSS